MPFIPLEATDSSQPRGKFVPLDDSQPGMFDGAVETVKDIGRVYPVAEAGANLASQAVVLPVAGLAGLGAVAAKAVGLTNQEPEDVVRNVAGALTYQPRTQSGQHLTQAAMYPFEKLAEAGRYAGDKVLDATGSPALSAAVDTGINVIPMALPLHAARPETPGEAVSRIINAGKARAQRIINGEHVQPIAPNEARPQPSFDDAPAVRGESIAGPAGRFIPLEDNHARSGTSSVAADDPALLRPDGQGFQELRRPGSDGVPGMADELPDIPAGRGQEARSGSADMAGTPGFERELRTDERGLGSAQEANIKPQVLPQDAGWIDDTGRGPVEGAAANHVEEADIDSALGHIESSASGEASVSSGLEARNAQWKDLERAGVGEAAGRQAADIAGAPASGSAAGTGIEVRRPAQTDQAELTSAKESMPESFPAQAGGKFIGLAEADAPEAATVMGRNVREMDDAMLARWSAMKTISPTARTTLQGEIARRKAEAVPDIPAEQSVMQKSVKPAKPLSENEVLLSARDKTMATGIQHEVIQHPTAAGKYAAVPVRDETLNAWAPGANYVPLMSDTAAEPKAGSVAELPSPIRRENIIARFAKALGTTVYEGRVKGKRLGFFRPGVEEVRTKRANDIEVAAHEVAHLIDHRTPDLKNAWEADKELAAELKSVSYDQKNVREGFAEAMRLFLTQPEALEAKAPKASAWLNAFANSHEYGPALRKAQEQMTAWFGQDALNRARSKIGTDKPLAEYFDRF